MTATSDYGPFGEVAEASIEHFNEHHDDTVAFLATALTPLTDVRAARMTAVDHDGIGLDVQTGDGTVPVRVSFAQRAVTADEAYHEFLDLVAAARRRTGGDDLTSIEIQLASAPVVPTHVTTVREVVDLNPRLRQVTVAGGLERFVPMAPDQFVYVLAPPPGRSDLTVDASFTWERYEEMPEAERPVGAYYTVRRWRPEARTLDIWVVLHGHGGAGERWARQARPGDPVALWGPRQGYARPADTDAVVLVADETAVPAAAAIAERLDPADRALLILALAEGAQPVPISSPAEIDVRWLVGGVGTLLGAVRELPAEAITASTYVWGGGESHEMTAIRRLVRDELGLPRAQVSLTAYWRHAG
jgi:NADPH-dependent ferric siderophore reductase